MKTITDRNLEAVYHLRAQRMGYPHTYTAEDRLAGLPESAEQLDDCLRRLRERHGGMDRLDYLAGCVSGSVQHSEVFGVQIQCGTADGADALRRLLGRGEVTRGKDTSTLLLGDKPWMANVPASLEGSEYPDWE